ncbi:MAG: nucleoside deaminase [Actinomycetes bacterium]
MRIALDEAMRPAPLGAVADLPIGAIVLDPNGTVIARARNQREATGDPTAHAEVLALREAAAVRGEWRLTDCTLVVTLEPCPMCAGAATMARVSRVVFGAWNEEYGAAGSHWDLLRDRRMAHRPEVVAGVLEDECGRLVLDFMAERREEKA